MEAGSPMSPYRRNEDQGMPLWQRACTVSIFLALVAAVVASIVIHVPNMCWWSKEFSFPDQTTALALWILANVFAPLCLVFVLLLALMGLWEIAEAVCGKLRKVFRG